MQEIEENVIMRSFVICAKYSLRMAKSKDLRWKEYVGRLGEINAY
jgi:hypothetical protein